MHRSSILIDPVKFKKELSRLAQKFKSDSEFLTFAGLSRSNLHVIKKRGVLGYKVQDKLIELGFNLDAAKKEEQTIE